MLGRLRLIRLLRVRSLYSPFNALEYGDDTIANDTAVARCEELIGTYGEDNVAFTI